MTSSRDQSRRSPKGTLIASLALLLVVGAAVGAYGNWVLWHPMDGVMVVIAGAIALLAGAIALLAGAVLVAVRRRHVRRSGAALLVLGVGVVAGYYLGPDRPPLRGEPGRTEIALEGPVQVRAVTGATCERDDNGRELQLHTVARLPLLPDNPAAPPDVDQRAFVAIVLTIGDRWRDGRVHRSDNVDLWVSVGGVTDLAAERVLAASDASDISIDWTGERGTLRFAGLVDASEQPAADATLITLRGSLEWVCGDAALPAGARDFAESVCVDAPFDCVDGILAAVITAPGSEVAICEAEGMGMGQVVPVDEVDVSEMCRGDGETFKGRVLRVVRLPQ